MRTSLFLLAGLCLLVAFFVLARLFSAHYPGAMNLAFGAYVVVWLVVAGVNMWVGVVEAGYSATEELPIFLLIFCLPLVVAGVIRWRLP